MVQQVFSQNSLPFYLPREFYLWLMRILFEEIYVLILFIILLFTYMFWEDIFILIILCFGHCKIQLYSGFICFGLFSPALLGIIYLWIMNPVFRKSYLYFILIYSLHFYINIIISYSWLIIYKYIS